MELSWRRGRIGAGLATIPAIGLGLWLAPAGETAISVYVLPIGLAALSRWLLLIELIRYLRSGLARTVPFERTLRSVAGAAGDLAETWLYTIAGTVGGTLLADAWMRLPLTRRQSLIVAGLFAVTLTAFHLVGRTLSLLPESVRRIGRRVGLVGGLLVAAAFVIDAGLETFSSQRRLVDSLAFHPWWDWFLPARWLEATITSLVSYGTLPSAMVNLIVFSGAAGAVCVSGYSLAVSNIDVA